MAVDEVAELLARWRGASGMFDRGRVVADGIRLLRELDDGQRRELAGALAELGLPVLAGQVVTRGEGTLDDERLWVVADGLLALDDEQVGHLVATLRDPDERGGLAWVAAAGRLTGERRDPDRGPDDQSAGDIDLGSVELGSADLVDLDLHEVDLLDDASGDGSTDAGADGSTDSTGPAGETPAPDRPAPDDPATDDGPAPDDPATDDRPAPDDLATGVREQDLDGHPTARWPGPAPLPGAGEEEPPTLARQIAEASTATRRLRLLDPERLRTLDGSAALAVLDALPEGWQRRRAAGRLLDAGVLPTDRLEAVLERFDRPTDAMFVAGALTASHQVPPEAFDGILPERAVRRLIARGAR